MAHWSFVHENVSVMFIKLGTFLFGLLPTPPPPTIFQIKLPFVDADLLSANKEEVWGETRKAIVLFGDKILRAKKYI